jgi:hypothetical protein
VVTPSNERGATMVEMAVSLPAFILVLLCGLELLRFAIIMLASQMAVIEGIRHVITGECGAATCNSQSRAQYAQQLIVNTAAGLGVELAQTEICVRPALGSPCSAQNPPDAGNPRDVIVAEVDAPFQLLVGIQLSLSIRASAIGRNEPFSE